MASEGGEREDPVQATGRGWAERQEVMGDCHVEEESPGGRNL